MRYLALGALLLASCGKDTKTIIQEVPAPSGDVTVLGNRIVITNADGSVGFVPFSTANGSEISGKLVYSDVLAYAAANNVKNDLTNAVLVGSLLTVVTINKPSKTIRIQISGAGISFDKTIKQ